MALCWLRETECSFRTLCKVPHFAEQVETFISEKYSLVVIRGK